MRLSRLRLMMRPNAVRPSPILDPAPILPYTPILLIDVSRPRATDRDMIPEVNVRQR